MVVDSDLSNYKDFIESVTDKYPPGYLEVAHVQYYDVVLKNFSEVKSDHDLMSMFDIHCKEKVVQMFVSYCDPSRHLSLSLSGSLLVNVSLKTQCRMRMITQRMNVLVFTRRPCT